MDGLRIGYQRFTSCSGCQLALLNCEAELPALAAALQLVDFVMLCSANDDHGPLDLALAEGSIATPEELQRLLDLRRRARLLAAVGACALSGGVNGLADPGQAGPEQAPHPGAERIPAQPLSRFVRVDLELPGCPPEGSDYLRLIGALHQGGKPAVRALPVCMECRQRENRCLLIEGRQPCLGPVTRGGCNARCPSCGVVCEGCRGMVAAAQRDVQGELLGELGLGETEVRRRMARFEREGS